MQINTPFFVEEYQAHSKTISAIGNQNRLGSGAPGSRLGLEGYGGTGIISLQERSFLVIV